MVVGGSVLGDSPRFRAACLISRRNARRASVRKRADEPAIVAPSSASDFVTTPLKLHKSAAGKTKSLPFRF